MITTGVVNAGPNLVSIGLAMVRRKVRAGLFPEKRLKRYERWPPSHLKLEENPKNDEQTQSNTTKIELGSYEIEKRWLHQHLLVAF